MKGTCRAWRGEVTRAEQPAEGAGWKIAPGGRELLLWKGEPGWEEGGRGEIPVRGSRISQASRGPPSASRQDAGGGSSASSPRPAPRPPGNCGSSPQTAVGAGGMEEEEAAAAEPEADPAAAAAAQRLCRCAARGLGVPPERWERWAGGGAAGPALREFVRGAAGPALLAWRGPSGELALGPPPPPPAARPKALFFLRAPGAGPGPAELLCGDLPADALRHFASLVEEVSKARAAPEAAAGASPRVVAPEPWHRRGGAVAERWTLSGQVPALASRPSQHRGVPQNSF